MSMALASGSSQACYRPRGVPAATTTRRHSVPAAKHQAAGPCSTRQAAVWRLRCAASSGHHIHDTAHSGGSSATTTTTSSSSSSSSSSSRRQLLSGTGSLLLGGQLMWSQQQPAAALQEQELEAGAPPALPLVPTALLGGDLVVSRVVKGCWQLSGGHKGEADSDRTSGNAAVEDFGAFAAAGITSWDAADHYGPAESLIGRYLAAHPQQRPEVQVLTKYCVFSALDMSTLSAQGVIDAVERSRSRLGVDTIDLLQLYWQDYAIPKYVDAALYLADLQAQGVIRQIGATNFDVPRLEAITGAGVRLASHQVQYSLLDRRPENGMAEFCAANGIGLLPYGVVGGGFLSDRYLGVPAKAVSVNTTSKGKYASVLGQAGGWGWLQELLGVLSGVAAKHGTTIANVASRWVLQRPGVPAIILGARNAAHIPDHRALFTFELDGDDLGAIQDVLSRGQQAKGDCYTWERGGRW